jgi:hypothetical protein
VSNARRAIEKQESDSRWVIRTLNICEEPITEAPSMTGQPSNEPAAAHSVQRRELRIWEPDSITWELDRPNGCKLTLLEGDWNTPGVPFTYAFFMPDGVWFPPHSRPSDARVIVARGTLLLGLGARMDKATARVIGPGATAFVPANLPHFEGSRGETIIIGSAVPPWGTTFIS